MDIKNIKEAYHLVKLLRPNASMEVFLYWALEALCDLTGVDRAAYLRYDQENQQWVLGADKVIAGLSQMPGGYVFRDMPAVETVRLFLDQWFFSPTENIGFDAIYPFEVDNGKAQFIAVLAIDDTAVARQFNEKEKKALDWIGHDLSQIIKFKKQILKNAEAAGRSYEDEMLGLGNRRAFQERLNACCSDEVHLVIIDLDHFKSINDTYGHEKGDQVLIAFSRILKKYSQAEFFRTGGDEFAGLVKGSASSADKVVQLILADFNSLSIGERKLGFSSGICQLSSGVDRRICWRAADVGAYFVKRNGRNGIKRVQASVTLEFVDIVGKKLAEITHLFV